MPNGLWFAAAAAAIGAAWLLDRRDRRRRFAAFCAWADAALAALAADTPPDGTRTAVVGGVEWTYTPGKGWDTPATRLEFPGDALCRPSCPDDDCTAVDGCQRPDPPSIADLELPPATDPRWDRLWQAIQDVGPMPFARGDIPARPSHLRSVE